MTRPLLQCSLETTWEELYFTLRLNMVRECINGGTPLEITLSPS